MVNLDNTAQEVVDHFRQFVHAKDRLWATRMRRGEYHNVNAMEGTYVDGNVQQAGMAEISLIRMFFSIAKPALHRRASFCFGLVG